MAPKNDPQAQAQSTCSELCRVVATTVSLDTRERLRDLMASQLYPRRTLRFPHKSVGALIWWDHDPKNFDENPTGFTKAHGEVIVEQGCRALLELKHVDAEFLADMPYGAIQGLKCRWDNRMIYRYFDEGGDRGPIPALESLQWLRVKLHELTDIAPLQNLHNLHSIRLSSTMVRDLAPLQHLYNLQTLDLRNIMVSDIKALQNLHSLRWLMLSSTSVRDITPLQNLLNLQTLYLTETQVSDITPLQNLHNLQSLNLWGTQVSDITPLQNLHNLQSLNLTSEYRIPIPDSLKGKVRFY